MNIVSKTALTLLSLVMLSSCSVDKLDQPALSANSDKQICLSSSPLTPLQAPPGISLPPENADYLIPAKPLQAKRPQTVDIRPPIQPLALLPGSLAYYQNEQAYLQFANNQSDGHALWQQLNRWLVEQPITIIERHERQKMLTTDWISWPDADNKRPYSARYQLAVQLQDAKLTIIIRLTALGQPVHGETALKKKLWDPSERRRYTLLMLNRIATALEKQRSALESQPQVAPLPATSEKPHG